MIFHKRRLTAVERIIAIENCMSNIERTAFARDELISELVSRDELDLENSERSLLVEQHITTCFKRIERFENELERLESETR